MEKPLEWIGSSKKDLINLPKNIHVLFGYALYKAQIGSKHNNTKILKGFHGSSTLEIIADDSDGTYRAVYTIKFDDVVFVLHVFQKKSKQEIETPKKDIDLIKNRLKLAELIYKEKYIN